ncbi:MAG: TrkA family potassium uptake protein [Anaerolineaceae bacterium]|jgi:trk system potassium uptake protein TrkA|nr:TrkA family potassium uptake protein [Anaerolineaceae bacterium]
MKVMIIGGGKVGTFLADFLLKEKHEVTVVEINRGEHERLHRELGEKNVVSGSGTDPDVLESAGIHNMNVLAAVTGSDEANLVVTSIARYEFNVPRVIARVNNPKNAWLFTPDMGVDVALNQAELIGHLILEEMSMGDMVTLLKLRKGQYSIVEEKVDPQASIVGKRLGDVNLPDQCVIVALLRREGMVIPHGDFVFRSADEVIVLAHSSQMEELANLLGPAGK